MISIDEAAIRDFIEKLNVLEGITLQISGEIEELSQQEYRGKRIWVVIKDDTGHSLKTKMDLGVHKNIQIEQDEFCFDVCHDDEGVSLLMNSKEQIFAEKLRALVKFGTFSGRVKDVFDLCYLSEYVDKERLLRCIHTYIPQRAQNVSSVFPRENHSRDLDQSLSPFEAPETLGSCGRTIHRTRAVSGINKFRGKRTGCSGVDGNDEPFPKNTAG